MTKSRDTADINSGTNTAVGEDALENNTASNNTAVGYQAGYSNTTGNKNVTLGGVSGYDNTTGRLNTFVGYNSGANNTTADSNTFMGESAGFTNTTGQYNTAIGQSALVFNTTASYNTAVGYQAGYSNTTGADNTFIGNYANYYNTTGSFITAVGKQALNSNTASYNTAVGWKALYTNTTSEQSCAIGFKALELSTGNFNTALGAGSGRDISTGSKNTIIGTYGGNQNGLDIRTSNNNIVLSDGDGNPRLHYNSSGSTNIYSTGTGLMSLISNYGAGTGQALLTGVYSATDITGTGGTVSLRIWTNGNIQNTNNSYTALSDQKLKENIVDANPQWDDIKALRVRNYNMIEGQTHRQIGLIAQEVETVSAGLVYDTADYDASGNDLGTFTKSVNYSVLYMKAVKALQEAMARIETLETKVATLEGA